MLSYFKIFVVVLTFCDKTSAVLRCVRVRGRFTCNDPSADNRGMVDVRIMDRDGLNVFKVVDSDDLMGIGFYKHNGTITVAGCGTDFDWPGYTNLPDPYVRIRHYCNSMQAITLDLPEFDVFMPETYDIGSISLDTMDSDSSLPMSARFNPAYSQIQRISHGQIVPGSEFQFAVFLNTGCSINGVYRSLGTCTASIISRKHVVTAGHCISEQYEVIRRCDVYKKAEEDGFRLPFLLEGSNGPFDLVRKPIRESYVILSHDRDDSLSRRNLKSISIHPDYLKGNNPNRNDLAILELLEELDGSISSVPMLENYVPTMTDHGLALGFGRTNESLTEPDDLDHDGHSYQSSRYLREDFLAIEPTCTDGIICSTMEKTPRHITNGDSGGPLLQLMNGAWTIIGIHQSADPNAGKAYHAMPNCKWVSSVVKDSTCSTMASAAKRETNGGNEDSKGEKSWWSR